MRVRTIISIPAKSLQVGDELVVDGMVRVSGLPVQEIFDTGHGRIQVTLEGEKYWFSADDLVAVWRGPE